VSEQQRNPDELGALWIKSGAKGEYMTGTINGQAVVVFRNDRKQGNQPDWRVLKSRTRDERAAQADPDDF
jgi:uncharacterized protein (DUF736 family)